MAKIKLLNGEFIDETLIIPDPEWVKGRKWWWGSIASWFKPKPWIRPANYKLLPRADRRNAARDDHALGAWRSGKHHVRLHASDQIIVPFSIGN